jgi:uncharacterized Zn finger protein
MAIANPRIHIICGICGCNKMLSFEIKEEELIDENDKFYKTNTVTIACDNCGSITQLDELMKEENGQKRYTNSEEKH